MTLSLKCYLYKMSNIYTTSPNVDNEDELLYHQVHIFKRTESEWYKRHGMNEMRTVMDIGCGTGQSTLSLLEQFPHVTIHAIDCNPDYVARCRRNTAPYEDRVTCSVQTIKDVSGEQVDAIVCRLVWMHVDDPNELIRTIHRLLKPNGLVFFLTSENHISDCIWADFIYDPSYQFVLEAYDTWHAMRLTNSDIIPEWKAQGFSVRAIEVLTAHTELDPPDSFRQKLHPKHMYGVVHNNIITEEAYQQAVAVFEADTSPIMMVSHLWTMIFRKD